MNTIATAHLPSGARRRPGPFSRPGARAALSAVAAAALGWLALAGSAGAAEVRIKDIVRIAGLERVNLIGYGVIVGLNGTGDKDIALSRQTMANLMEHFDLSLNMNDIKSKNVAAVVVTAVAEPFHAAGDRVDVDVASVGDATSLEGGVLLMTTLLDPEGEVYAIAQGAVTVGGFSAGKGGRGGETVSRNSTTVALIPGAAVLRQGQTVDFYRDGMLRLLLRHPDFTTASRIATAINAGVGSAAIARDAGTVAVHVPKQSSAIGQLAGFISRMECLTVEPDAQAKIIVNERTGTIIIGRDVHIGEAVVAHGNLTVTIKETLTASQPSNLMIGNAQPGSIRSLETPNTQTTVNEDTANVMVVPATTTVQDLADALNRMGGTPRDLISILVALRRAGAFQTEIEVM